MAEEETVEEVYEEYEYEDIDSLIEVALSKISSRFTASGADGLLKDINTRKELHKILCDIYHKGYRLDIPLSIHAFKWGNYVSYSYDKFYDVFSPSSMYTLLSLLIAERYLLAKHKGLLKHVTVGIVGLSGAGKTTYSIASVIGALSLIGMNRDEVMKLLPGIIHFEPSSFLDFVKKSIEDRVWVPVVLLDDVGAQISKYWLWLGERWWAHLFSLLDHLKDWCGVLVITSTSFTNIPSRLREKIDLVVEASEATYKGAVFDLLLWYRRDKYFGVPSRMRSPIYMDVFPPTALMPKEIWSKMMEDRRMLGLKRIDMVIESFKKIGLGLSQPESQPEGSGEEVRVKRRGRPRKRNIDR